MRRSTIGLLCLGLLLNACGGVEENQEVSARNLGTGDVQVFGSPADVPPGWSVCSDPTCTVPPKVPCDQLGPKVCALSSECRLKTLWCMGSGTTGGGAAGSTPPAPPPPTTEKCEYTCIPKLPLLCEELSDQQSCGARPDCDWGQLMCPAIACAPGSTCPPCPAVCHTKPVQLCGSLGEQQCLARPDCAWGADVCPMSACAPCAPGSACPPCPTCKSTCKPATTKPCQVSECGPALGMPNKICPDGKTVSGPSGRCLRQAAGTCGWEVLDCPTTPPPLPPPPPPAKQCVVTGCSGTLCAASEQASTCEWADYYQCYSLAVCGLKNGVCGWTETPDFVACVAKFKQP